MHGQPHIGFIILNVDVSKENAMTIFLNMKLSTALILLVGISKTSFVPAQNFFTFIGNEGSTLHVTHTHTTAVQLLGNETL